MLAPRAGRKCVAALAGRLEKCAGGWSPDWSAPTHRPALLVRLPPRFLRSSRLRSQCMLHRLVPLSRVLAGSGPLAAPKSVPEGGRPTGPPPHTVLPSLSDLPPRFLRSPRLRSQCMLHRLVPLSRVLAGSGSLAAPKSVPEGGRPTSPDWSAPTQRPALLVRLAASVPALAPTALPMHLLQMHTI